MFEVIKDNLMECEFNAFDTYLIEAVSTLKAAKIG